MTSKIYTAQEAVGEAWASIDGKLDEFRSANQTVMEGWRDGYLSDAESLIERAAKRGWVLVPAGREDALTEEVERLKRELQFALTFIENLANDDLDELIADGGVTLGMGFQQQARTVYAPRINAALKGKDQ